MASNPHLVDGVKSPQNIYDVLSVAYDTNKRPYGVHPVGTRGALPDGRVFYYALVGDGTYGGAVVRGNVVGQITPSIAANINVAVAAAPTGSGANAAGSKYVALAPATTDIAANFYKDGYLYVNDVTGEGLTMKIVGHSAADVSTSPTILFELDDPLPLSLTAASSEVTLIRNPYDRVGAATDLAELVVGVAPVSASASTAPATDVSVTASGTAYFMWLQTWGPAAVLQSDTTARGGQMTTTATDGTVAVAAAVTSTIIGTQITVGVATEYRAVDLRIRA